MRRFVLTVAVLSITASPSLSSAQTGFALSRLTPAPLPGDGLHAERARGLGHLKFAGAATFDYAHDPLMRTRAEHGVGVANRDRVTSQTFATPSIALGLFERVTLYAALPISLYQSGAGYELIPNRRRTVLGDVRLGARGTILGHEKDARFRLAVAADLFVPSGSRTSWTSDEGWRGRLAALVEAHPTPNSFVVANVGVHFRPDRRALDMRSGTEASVVLAGGLTVRPELDVGLELATATGLRDATFLRVQTTPIEALAVATYRLGPIYVTVGGGPGFGHAAGTPTVRLALRVGYAMGEEAKRVAPPPPPPPPPPGPTIADKDGDGIGDSVDACPNLKGPESGDPALHGCPDGDGDGVADPNDACPTAKGPHSDDPKKNGCPLAGPKDRDKDGIFDDADACPDTPGDYSEDPKKNGCPEG